MEEQQNDLQLERASSCESVTKPRCPNGNAWKVASLTVLVCLLLVGQGFMAYYIMDLKDILQTLEQGQDTLKKEEEYKIFCAAVVEPQCEVEAEKIKRWLYQPQCDEEGNYKPKQCLQNIDYCWCVDKNGKVIPGTQIPGLLQCGSGKG